MNLAINYFQAQIHFGYQGRDAAQPAALSCSLIPCRVNPTFSGNVSDSHVRLICGTRQFAIVCFKMKDQKKDETRCG